MAFLISFLSAILGCCIYYYTLTSLTTWFIKKNVRERIVKISYWISAILVAGCVITSSLSFGYWLFKISGNC